jgi:molybdenum cofactor cytidylyltransferase
MRFALVPAGGHSTRMGRPKLALPLGDRTILEWVIAAIRAGGVDHTLVVVGAHVPELALLAEKAAASVCLLGEVTADMRGTVQQGLEWIEHRYHPGEGDVWLLAPGDHPTLEPAIVQSLLEAQESQPNYSIWVPTFEGRRGHPTLISWKHAQQIRQLPADQGINLYLRGNQAETLEVPTSSRSVLQDVDVPKDYDDLRQKWTGGSSREAIILPGCCH